MASIIKNQLLKHLSRFTKNLSADKVNLSTFKGEGELTNLELNEIVLTDLLELPSWLRITNALCNKVTFRIQWTKLKNVPIHLSLDEVNITAETCEELRPMSSQPGLSTTATIPGKYGFIHKVIDGITVTVNTVNITFNSPAFTASVQVCRVTVESKDPTWRKADLRMTRLKEPDKGQLLIFKELEWQTVRIEAKSTKDRNLAPLRLLTNEARCRVTIKKRTSDCFILGSRLIVILNDLLWVLTDSQLKAALHFLDSLAGLVEKATVLTRKTKAARKLEELPEYRAHLAQQARVYNSPATNISKIFSQYDVIETSYHFLAQQVMLHLCDDPGPGRSTHPNLKNGAALEISIIGFQVDYYPYHLANSDRKHWPRYNEASIPHTRWQEQALSSFRTRLIDLIDKHKLQHTPLNRANMTPKQEDLPPLPRDQSPTQVKKFVLTQLAKLMTTCAVLRMEDFTLYKVSTSGKKECLKEFIAAQHKRKDRNVASGDRGCMKLPDSTNIIHAEFIYFYYPDDTPFPLPPPKFYVQVNPIQICFDVESCIWFNCFALNLHQSLVSSKEEIASNMTYIDVKIEAILPKLTFESSVEYHNQRDRPKTLNFQVTRATITNVRSLEQSSRADLAKCVNNFHIGSLFFGSEFPSEPDDYYIITQKFLDHISAADNIRTMPTELNASSVNTLLEQLSRELLWVEAKDMWSIHLDPVFGEFVGARAVGSSKSVTFIDAVPITIWCHANMDPNSTVKTNDNGPKNADIHVLAHISNLISVQINHYQLLFMLRLAEELAELATFISMDTNRIIKTSSESSIAIGALLPQLEVTFVMPSQCPGKESSGGDLESFVPDSSSIPDDMLAGSQATMWQTSNLSITQTEFKDNLINGFTIEAQQGLETYQSKDKQSPAFSNNFNAGLSSMKKGFSNLMTSIDSALKPTEEFSDTMSIRSNASSDSDNYVLVNSGGERIDALEAAFRVTEYDLEHRSVEVASEVEEDGITSNSEHSFASSCKRKDLVSVSTFKLNKIELLHQSIGYSSNVKVQIGNIDNEDCNSIPWDEFQTKFTSRSKAWTNIEDENSLSRIKLRYDHQLKLANPQTLLELDMTNKENLHKVFNNFINILVTDLHLNLSMSTITGLVDLIEDEIIPFPIPMELVLNNVKLHLIEDRPPANITSPTPVPVDLDINQLRVTRSEDGTFHMVPPKTLTNSLSNQSAHAQNDTEINGLQQICKQLRSDNEELRKRLVAFERVAEENRNLRQAEEETEVLRTCLITAQEKVAQLLDEKTRLLREMRELQEQTDGRRQWTTKR